MKESENILFRIDSLLYDKGVKMKFPTIEEDLGILFYFATRYKYTNNIKFKDKSITLLNNLIDVFQDKDLPSSFIEGFEGVYWVINFLNKCNIITDEEILSDLHDFLYDSIRIDIKTNNFDLLHGYIGKIKYLIHSKNHNKEKVNRLIDDIINSLYKNSKEFKDCNGLYWYDLEGRNNNSINIGLAHGIPSVLVFLTKLHSLGFKNPLIKIMIIGIINLLLFVKNDNNEISSYGDEIVIDEKINSIICKVKISRLGWCYGDIGISYSIYFAGLIMGNELWKGEATKIIKKACRRGLSDSGITHFNDYSFFDVAFCHGISGITYVLKRMSCWIDDKEIKNRLIYWENELLKNTNTFLNIKDDIYYPYDKQDKNYTYIVDKENFLSGITGTGLVIQSILYNRFEWSHLLSIY